MADRFIREGEGSSGKAIDLATGNEVWIIERQVAGDQALRRCEEGYARLMACWHSRLAPVIDAAVVAPDRIVVAYPFLPEGPPLEGEADAKAEAETETELADAEAVVAVERVSAFLAARGLNAKAWLSHWVRWREGRVVIQPEWEAGELALSAEESTFDAASRTARGSKDLRAQANGTRRAGRARLGRVDRDVGIALKVPAAVGAVVAGLESVNVGDVRPYFVAAARGVGFTTFVGMVAREVRRLGMVPVSMAAWRRWPDIASRLEGRSVVLLVERGDREMRSEGHVGCAISALASSGSHLAGVIAWVEPGASVATLTLPPLAASELRERVWISDARRVRAANASSVGSREVDGLLALARKAEGLPGVFVSALLGDPRVREVDRRLKSLAESAADEGKPVLRAAERMSPWFPRDVSAGGGGGGGGASRSARRVVSRRGAGELGRVGARARGAPAQAAALLARRRWSEASRVLHRDVEFARRRGDDAATSDAALAMGRVRLAMADAGSARRWFTQAAARAIEGRSDGQAMESVAWLGLAALEDADLSRAERLLRASLLTADYCAMDYGSRSGGIADVGSRRSGANAIDHSNDKELIGWRRWVSVELGRCLYWQGRFREVEIPDAGEDDGDGFGSIAVERLAVRLHLARGEVGRAAERLVVATRMVAKRQDEEMACAVEGDAATLQLMIGDVDACDRYLRDGLSRRCSRARMLRLYLVLYARLSRGETAAQRRRAERLAATLLKSSSPPLVRIRARYLIEGRGRRWSRELAAYVSRYGETALVSGTRLAGGDHMWEDLQALLQICHEASDERQALAQACAHVKERVGAARVAVFLNPDGAVNQSATVNPNATVNRNATGGEPASVAAVGSSRLSSVTLARRVIDGGVFAPVAQVEDAREAGAPVRYGGRTLGAIVCRWAVDARPDEPLVGAMLMAAGAAFAPMLRALLDREPGLRSEDGSSAGAGAGRGAPGILGVSSAISQLRSSVRRVASAPFMVLIEGESGSGKELVARALHFQGPRRHRRFAAINCAAVSDELFESEMFGHVRGAFTGAITEREGLFEEADGGTLFLDEVGELSARGQAKLLRVIQEGEVRRVGENLPRKVDVRIVAATNRSLKDEVRHGRFRADLLYRLDVIRLVIPPLRERPEDIPILALAFWEEAIGKTRSRATLAPETLAVLARYDWPGNVRELHNAMMALAAQAPVRGRIRPVRLPTAIASGGAVEAAAGPVMPLVRARRAFEERYVRAALVRAGGRASRAARELGLTRHGLRKVMVRLGLDAGGERGARVDGEVEADEERET